MSMLFAISFGGFFCTLLYSDETRRTPTVIVWQIDPVSDKPTGDSVPIWSFGDVYGPLGVTGEKFSAWSDANGFDSLGVSASGEFLIPGFPVFSKVAWAYVDPVDLTPAETKELVDECNRAVSDLGSEQIFIQIRDLALRAIEKSTTVRFGHP